MKDFQGGFPKKSVLFVTHSQKKIDFFLLSVNLYPDRENSLGGLLFDLYFSMNLEHGVT